MQLMNNFDGLIRFLAAISARGKDQPGSDAGVGGPGYPCLLIHYVGAPEKNTKNRGIPPLEEEKTLTFALSFFRLPARLKVLSGLVCRRFLFIFPGAKTHNPSFR